MKNKILLFWLIVILTIGSIAIIKCLPTRLGLDLKGGSRILLEAQTTETISKVTQDMMDALKVTLDRRINPKGISEITIQQVEDKRLLIEIPKDSDLKEVRKKCSYYFLKPTCLSLNIFYICFF